MIDCLRGLYWVVRWSELTAKVKWLQTKAFTTMVDIVVTGQARSIKMVGTIKGTASVRIGYTKINHMATDKYWQVANSMDLVSGSFDCKMFDIRKMMAFSRC
jgi:hypothetical protein